MSLLFAFSELFSVAVLSITTGDAAPAAAPYKVSAQTGKDQALVSFDVTGVVTAVQVRDGGVDPTTGTLVATLGAVAGVSQAGHAKVVDRVSADDVLTIAYADIPSPSDGDRTLNAYAHGPDGAFA